MDRGHVRARAQRAAAHRGRGQSMVEFAVGVPIFIVLLFATLEVGLLFKTRAAYQEAAQEAVRVGAAAGNATDADTQLLSQLKSMLPDESLQRITSVTIYDATVTGSYAISPTVSDNAHTNYVYDPTANSGAGGFVCAVPTTLPHQTPPCTGESYWDPLSRNTTVGSLDHIGIQIKYDYQGVTHVLPLMHFTQSSATIIEPSSFPP